MTKQLEINRLNLDFGEVHLIPFDLGYMFYDMYTPSNEDNYFLWQEFANKLKQLETDKNSIIDYVICKEVSEVVHYNPNQKKKNGKKAKLNFVFNLNNEKNKNYAYLDIVEDCLCEIKFKNSDLYCYILDSGICVFVLGNFDNKGIKTFMPKDIIFDKAINMLMQRKIINDAILLDESIPESELNKLKQEAESKKQTLPFERGLVSTEKNSLAKVLVWERGQMLQFKIWCWQAIREIVDGINKNLKANKKWPCKRPHTSNRFFKNFGFSFTRNFIVDDNLSSKQVNYLCDRSISIDEYGKEKTWIDTNKYFKNVEYQNVKEVDIVNTSKGKTIQVPPLNIVKENNFNVTFAWNSIIVEPKNKTKITSIKDFLKHKEMRDLLFAEIDIITRWFNADNCINNSIENEYSNLENLQTIQGLIDYYSAELENSTSSKMDTLYLMYRSRIVESTRITEVYKSVSDKIKIMKGKKIEQDKAVRDKNDERSRVALFFVDLFIAVFTGAGIGKTAVDVWRGQYNAGEIALFVSAVIVFIGIRVFIYIFDRKKKKKLDEQLKKM